MATRVNKKKSFTQKKKSLTQKKKSYTQKQINKGQKKINGALCQVDWDIIYSVKALIKALKDRGVLTDAQLSRATKFIDEAKGRSATVAAIDPPGCDPALQIPREPDIKAA